MNIVVGEDTKRRISPILFYFIGGRLCLFTVLSAYLSEADYCLLPYSSVSYFC